MKLAHFACLLALAFGLSAMLIPVAFAAGPIDVRTGVSAIHPSAGAPRPAVTAAQAVEVDAATYHYGATLYCSQCHVMHASEQHDLDNAPTPDIGGAFPRTFTPGTKLLKATDPVALCLMCHDGLAGVPDVVGADVNNLTERAGGFFAAVGTNNDHGHKIAYGVQPGNGSYGDEPCIRCHFGGDPLTAAVSCIDCHNPHGNNRARNLQWASAPGYEDVFSYFINPSATGLARYERANVGYGTVNNYTGRELTSMCKDCHHVFSGEYYTDADHDNIHSRHPSYDSESSGTNNIAQGATRGSSDPTHWVDGTGAGFLNSPRVRFVNSGATSYAASKTVNASTNGVFCLSCHKAHGTENGFGLIFPYGRPAGEGCDQCHNETGL